ncbi:MAG: NrdH-redoxin [Candidatus Niyogibacteria bacterium CG10_big_fil_rev_8_21_14_0_10_46_36]|uniref:NrdH-redoxin n=1 Tax=Candidatus Niyogibacteria bacterium CG10_big_fil_rev_8_21_14_0_10_46_36 TaxID=1974726 RepID=A0A2H0TE25_9BACT|nr:MAG: NrdH-redoxin [Candidatus Niyogibacteria bacterium CG10_big_fil_rev_8_21_14_0_10_46_36]
MEHKVSIYTTPSCQYCKMAKAFFQEHNIQYSEYNVATDAEKRNEMIERSGQMGVPVIDVDGNLVVGFNQETLSKLLGVS